MTQQESAHMAEFNQHNRNRLPDPINGIQSDRYDLVALLREAADYIEAFTTNASPTREEVDRYADVWCFLYEAQRIMPPMAAWRVMVKHTQPKRKSGWPDRVAMGCLNRAQAEAMAIALREHYTSKYGYDSGDVYYVDFGLVDINNVFKPEVTVEERMRDLM